MRTEVFSSPSLGLTIFREEDGLLSWTGAYKGAVLKKILALGEGDGYILLLDRDARDVKMQPHFKNLIGIAEDGTLRWIAELPRSPDVFVEARMELGGLSAWTWSGYKIQIDPISGKVLHEEFVK
jgi:hypothetical protein